MNKELVFCNELQPGVHIRVTNRTKNVREGLEMDEFDFDPDSKMYIHSTFEVSFETDPSNYAERISKSIEYVMNGIIYDPIEVMIGHN